MPGLKARATQGAGYAALAAEAAKPPRLQPESPLRAPRIAQGFIPGIATGSNRNSCQDHEADDLVQTVFLRMLEQIGTLKDPTRFHFWLFKIGRNHLINFARDRARQQAGLEGFADKARQDSESGTFWVRGTFEPSPEARLTVSETVDRRREVLRTTTV